MNEQLVEKYRQLVNALGKAIVERPEDFIDFESVEECLIEEVDEVHGGEIDELAKELGVERGDLMLNIVSAVMNRMIIDFEEVSERVAKMALEELRGREHG